MPARMTSAEFETLKRDGKIKEHETTVIEKAVDTLNQSIADRDSGQLKFDKSAEKKLQRECESYLSQRGYLRLTADTCNNFAYLPQGWYCHVFDSQKQPLKPDLEIYNGSMQRCLMVELKTRPVYQPGQKRMIEMGAWQECRSTKEFTEILKAWEDL